MRFIETSVFTNSLRRHLDDDQYRALQLALALRPEQGALIPGGGGLRKLRWGAQRTMRVIRRNIAFSIAYNLLGASLAISGVLTPLIAAVLMPASSLTVVFGAWQGFTFSRRRA